MATPAVLHRGYATHPKVSTTSSPSTFVSSHFVLQDATIEEFLRRLSLEYRTADEEYVVKRCPFCHATKGNPANYWKLHVKRKQGCYNCFRCGASGSWFDFKMRLRMEGDGEFPQPKLLGNEKGVSSTTVPLVLDAALRDAHLLLDTQPKALNYLVKERLIKPETLKKFRVGVVTQQFPDDNGVRRDHNCIVFPWTEVKKPASASTAPTALPTKGASSEGPTQTGGDSKQATGQTEPEPEVVPVRYKLRSLEDKKKQRILPTNAMLESAPRDSEFKTWGMFGWHLVPPNATEIVITEGEFDAMVVYQETGIPTVSLPNGASSFPVELLQRFEQFSKVYLWLDDDLRGREGANKFARKLGIGRCWIVSTRGGTEDGPKDANDALKQGKDLKVFLERATRIPHQQIVTFNNLMHEVYLELIDRGKVAGVQSSEFVTLNSLLKGFRKGELTIVTGPTGSGKTSFLSQYSLDFCKQGIPTLWGSFEISNVRLAKKMLTQFSEKSGEELVKAFPDITEQFSQLQLYFMRFYGSTNLERVLDAMEYAVYAHDVEHIVLDNLQFMTSGQAQGYDKFDLQDKVIEACRQFATTKNVHISLVIHPRKEDDNSSLSLSSVFGTAKATQEADNVIIIQKRKKFKFLDVRKNRFDGDLGRVAVSYNKKTLKYIDEGALTEEDVELMFSATTNNQSNSSNTMLPPPKAAKKPKEAPPAAAEEEAPATSTAAKTPAKKKTSAKKSSEPAASLRPELSTIAEDDFL